MRFLSRLSERCLPRPRTSQGWKCAALLQVLVRLLAAHPKLSHDLLQVACYLLQVLRDLQGLWDSPQKLSMVEVIFPHRCKEQITDLLEPGSSNLQIREERALQMETLEFEFSVVLSFFPHFGLWLPWLCWFHESRMLLECLFVLWGHQSWCLRRTAQWAFCLVCIGCIPCSVEGRVSDKEAALLKSLYELRFGWPNIGRYYHVYRYNIHYVQAHGEYVFFLHKQVRLSIWDI